MAGPRILFLDAYDSYSNNIVAVVESSLEASVSVIKIDDERLCKDEALFHAFLDRFDAVIAGPGPGNACSDEDVGLMKHLWTAEPPIPVLGVCLGFQSLALAFGAGIKRLREPKHGMQASVRHCGTSIFSSAAHVEATFYNSLHVDLGTSSDDMWTCTAKCPDLVPLAWLDDDGDNGPVCVSLEHANKPFWGVQYHPESICTNDEGAKVFIDWWHEAMAWLARVGARPLTPQSMSSATSTRQSIDGDSMEDTDQSQKVQWRPIPLDSWPTTMQHVQKWLLTKQHMVMLESGTTRAGDPVNPETGRFSILGCTDIDMTDRFEYRTSPGTLRHIRKGETKEVQCSPMHLWGHLSSFITAHRASCGPAQVPFWGGLVGFVSYEACLGTINVLGSSSRSNDAADSCFVFIDRSIVLDNVDKQIYVQSVRANDSDWISTTCDELRHGLLSNDFTFGLERDAIFKQSLNPSHSDHHESQSTPLATKPAEAAYQAKVEECKERVREGQAYEICLTDQTTISRPKTHQTSIHTGRALYSKLRTHNPAPFAAFFSLPTETGTLQVLSSSPERFLTWSRAGTCQFRPIKGTVRKKPGLTRADAEAALSEPKERAENLMIVDLIRHDLHGALGARAVRVPKLMVVEEYASVYQLVSVIEGDLNAATRRGIDVLAASLPPGSMTGAPKRRACELLQKIEDKPRGLYSGVLGYLDVGGGGDFSVVIRTAVNWTPAHDLEGQQSSIWTIGAGGAVTVQSTAEGEWEEMETKRDALFAVFGSDDV